MGKRGSKRNKNAQKRFRAAQRARVLKQRALDRADLTVETEGEFQKKFLDQMKEKEQKTNEMMQKLEEEAEKEATEEIEREKKAEEANLKAEEQIKVEPKEVQTISEEPKEEKVVSEEPKEEKIVSEEPKEEKAVPEEPKEEKPVSELKEEQTISEELKEEKPVSEESKEEKPVSEESKEEKVVSEEPKEEKIVSEEPKEEKPVSELKEEQTISEETKEEKIVSEESKEEKPVSEEPKEEIIKTEEPAVSADNKAEEEPVVEELVSTGTPQTPSVPLVPPQAESPSKAPVFDKRLRRLSIDPNKVKTKSFSTLALSSQEIDAFAIKAKEIDLEKVIVIDNGSSYIKVGVSGEDAPRCVVPTLIFKDPTTGKYVCGEQAALAESSLVENPIDPRKPVDWEKITILWKYIFARELKVDPMDYPVVVTELPTMSTVAQKKMEKIFFDTLCVPGYKMMNSAIVSLFAAGLSTGLVVSLGNRLQIIPVIDTAPIHSASYNLKVGVSNMTDYFARLLTGSGIYARTKKDMAIIRRLKEKYCYVAYDFVAENKKRIDDIEVTETIDGKKYTFSRERYECPEALFQPKLMGLDIPSIVDAIVTAVSKCPIDNRAELLTHIVLSGGSTLFKGFERRLEKEVKEKLLELGKGFKHGVKVTALRNRKYLAWNGMSTMSSLPYFVDREIKWVEDYHCEDDYVADEDIADDEDELEEGKEDGDQEEEDQEEVEEEEN